MLKTSRLAYGRAGTAVPTADDAYLLFSLLESTNPAPHTRRGMLCKGMVLPTSHREFAGTGGWLSVQRSKRWLINWSRAACDLEKNGAEATWRVRPGRPHYAPVRSRPREGWTRAKQTQIRAVQCADVRCHRMCTVRHICGRFGEDHGVSWLLGLRKKKELKKQINWS